MENGNANPEAGEGRPRGNYGSAVTGQLQDPVHIYVNTVENRRVDRFEIYSYVETY